MLSFDHPYPSIEEIERLTKKIRAERSIYIGDGIGAAIRWAGRALLPVPVIGGRAAARIGTRPRHRLKPIQAVGSVTAS